MWWRAASAFVCMCFDPSLYQEKISQFHTYFDIFFSHYEIDSLSSAFFASKILNLFVFISGQQSNQIDMIAFEMVVRVVWMGSLRWTHMNTFLSIPFHLVWRTDWSFVRVIGCLWNAFHENVCSVSRSTQGHFCAVNRKYQAASVAAIHTNDQLDAQCRRLKREAMLKCGKILRKECTHWCIGLCALCYFASANINSIACFEEDEVELFQMRFSCQPTTFFVFVTFFFFF